MKKIYVKPEMAIIEMESIEICANSPTFKAQGEVDLDYGGDSSNLENPDPD